jgi:hypothetical protein
MKSRANLTESDPEPGSGALSGMISLTASYYTKGIKKPRWMTHFFGKART